MSSQNAGDETEKPKGGKWKKILVLLLGGTALIGAGVGGAIYGLGIPVHGGREHAKEDPNRPKLVVRSNEPAEAGEEGKAPPPKVGTVSVTSDKSPADRTRYEVTYFPIEQTFTANLADGSGFIQVGISLATYFDGKVIANIARQQVPIRSAVLMVLSEQDSVRLQTAEGKQNLQRQLTDAINRVLREKENFGGIDNVYFTSLVIQ